MMSAAIKTIANMLTLNRIEYSKLNELQLELTGFGNITKALDTLQRLKFKLGDTNRSDFVCVKGSTYMKGSLGFRNGSLTLTDKTYIKTFIEDMLEWNGLTFNEQLAGSPVTLRIHLDEYKSQREIAALMRDSGYEVTIKQNFVICKRTIPNSTNTLDTIYYKKDSGCYFSL